jgi:hypothetical protein
MHFTPNTNKVWPNILARVAIGIEPAIQIHMMILFFNFSYGEYLNLTPLSRYSLTDLSCSEGINPDFDVDYRFSSPLTAGRPRRSNSAASTVWSEISSDCSGDNDDFAGSADADESPTDAQSSSVLSSDTFPTDEQRHK